MIKETKMSLSRFIIFCLSLLLALANISFAEDICPDSDKTPPPSGAEELKMYEKEFIFQHAMQSLEFLEKDVINIIKNHKGPHSVLENESFYISYPNSITFVKGTLLKQEVLIARNKLEVEKLKLKNKTGSIKEVSVAENIYLNAKNKFCEFLKHAEYVD